MESSSADSGNSHDLEEAKTEKNETVDSVVKIKQKSENLDLEE